MKKKGAALLSILICCLSMGCKEGEEKNSAEAYSSSIPSTETTVDCLFETSSFPSEISLSSPENSVTQSIDEESVEDSLSTHQHAFEKWDFEGDVHWEECACGESTVDSAHVFGGWQSKNGKHFKRCECGAISQEDGHTLDERNDCTVCHIHYGTEGLPYIPSADGNYYIVGEVEENSPIREAKEIYILSSYDGKPVRAIAEWAFAACNAERIFLPEGIVEIGLSAFQNCENMRGIRLPNSVERIGNAAFARCKNLTEISLGTNLTDIGDGVFVDCKALKEIALPKSLLSVGMRLIDGCNGLEKVSFADCNGWEAWSNLEGTEKWAVSAEELSADALAYLRGEIGEGEIALSGYYLRKTKE